MDFNPAGVDRLQVGNTEGAEACFVAALAENPNDPNVWKNLAIIAALRGNLDSAVTMTEKSILQDRGEAAALSHCNMAFYLIQAEKFKEAMDHLNEAKALGLNDYHIYINRATVHLSLSTPHGAIQNLLEAYKTAPQEKLKPITEDLGYAYLMAGDYQRGLNLLKDEWSIPPAPINALNIPDWDGKESLKEKTILVYHNQGHGDTIQFSRFLPLLKGGRIQVAVPKPLTELFQPAYNILNPPKDADFKVPFAALPYFLEARIDRLPHPTNFYFTSYKRKPDKIVRVGLIWAADAKNSTGLKRSIPLEQLLPLTLIPGIEFHGLQYGGSKKIKEIGAQHLIKDRSDEIRDFMDLAAIMMEMNFIVSADTAPLHLAGSLEIPSIGMLSHSGSDWRWLERDRPTTPWYPTMQLVRQQHPKDWSEAVNQVKEILTLDCKYVK